MAEDSSVSVESYLDMWHECELFTPWHLVTEQRENQPNIGTDLLQQVESDEKFIKLIIIDSGTQVSWVQ